MRVKNDSYFPIFVKRVLPAGERGPIVGGVAMSYKTRQKSVVWGVLNGVGRPLTAAQLLSFARRELPGIGLSTIYRLLKEWVEAGRIVKVELPDVGPVYEPARQEHHHFFVCEGCHAVLPLRGCVKGISRLLPKGAQALRHEFVAYGLCGECSSGKNGHGHKQVLA